MSETSYLVELREAAPTAPERLRGLVRSLPAATPRFSLRIRPAISAAIVTVLVVGIGASIYAGLRGDPAGHVNHANYFGAPAHSGGSKATTERNLAPSQTFEAQTAPGLTAKSRLQKQDVAMRLRVDDLSGATQSAVRTTRRLGGFVAGADYATGSNEGNSRLALRVPVANLQKAIASFTAARDDPLAAHLGRRPPGRARPARRSNRQGPARRPRANRRAARAQARRAHPRRHLRTRLAPADDRQACGEKRGTGPVRPLPGYVGRHSG